MESKIHNHPSARQKAVLVTGCSSGIGLAIAVRLAREGFIVFSTVRKEGDAERLGNFKESNIIPIYPLDLSTLDHIPRVFEAVSAEINRRGLPGLHALINNAGGGFIAPIEAMDMEKFRTELTARVIGATALVQAFLPSIRRARGRLVWIMTPATIPTSFVSSIHACDFAINCIVRTLALELAPWNIPIVMIRCGGIKTPAGMRTREDVESLLQSGSDRVEHYKERVTAWARSMTKFDGKRTEPEKVANLICKVLRARTPRSRYSVGHMAKFAGFLECLPQVLADRLLKMV